MKVFPDLSFILFLRLSVSPEGQGESAATAPSGVSVQLDRSNRPLSSLLEAKEVKAGKEAEDGLNKALFLPSLKKKPGWHLFLQKKDHCVMKHLEFGECTVQSNKKLSKREAGAGGIRQA